MKKRSLALLVFVLILSLLVAACGGKGGGSDTGSNAGSSDGAHGGGSGEKVTIKMFQFKVEIAEQLAKLIEEY